MAMCGNLQAKGKGTKMRDLAKEIDGCFRIATFELAVRGTHTAERANAAIGADGLAGDLGLTNFFEPAIPTLCKGARAQIVSVAMGKNTHGHATSRIDRAAVLTATTGVFFLRRWDVGSKFAFRQAKVFGFAS